MLILSFSSFYAETPFAIAAITILSINSSELKHEREIGTLSISCASSLRMDPYLVLTQVRYHYYHHHHHQMVRWESTRVMEKVIANHTEDDRDDEEA